jgi:hypothetical protein
MRRNLFVIIFLWAVLLTGNKLCAQEYPLSVKLGAIKTALKDNAINLGLRYLNSLDSLWEEQDYLFDGDHSLFLVMPDVEIQTGSSDAFSSVNVKATGLWMLFKTTEVAGVITPDTEKLFHTFPMSLGLETNNRFDRINTILEIGYVPWYQSAARKTPEWIKKTKLGFFIQGGYKFALDTAEVYTAGGAIDESMEELNDPLFRVKGSFGIDTRPIIKLNYLRMGLVGYADGWYDFMNSQVYHKIEGKIRMYLSPKTYFDFEYQNGSGAPNFNEGDQVGMALTVLF